MGAPASAAPSDEIDADPGVVARTPLVGAVQRADVYTVGDRLGREDEGELTRCRGGDCLTVWKLGTFLLLARTANYEDALVRSSVGREHQGGEVVLVAR